MSRPFVTNLVIINGFVKNNETLINSCSAEYSAYVRVCNLNFIVFTTASHSCQAFCTKTCNPPYFGDAWINNNTVIFSSLLSSLNVIYPFQLLVYCHLLLLFYESSSMFLFLTTYLTPVVSNLCYLFLWKIYHFP